MQLAVIQDDRAWFAVQRHDVSRHDVSCLQSSWSIRFFSLFLLWVLYVQHIEGMSGSLQQMSGLPAAAELLYADAF